MRGLWFLDFIFIPSKKRGKKKTLPKTTAHLPEPSLEDTGNKIFNKNVEKLALYSQRTLVYSLRDETLPGSTTTGVLTLGLQVNFSKEPSP